MTAIAFYAPLKSPHHPNPSGDRQIARNLLTALSTALDRPVHLASELRSFEPGGDDALQARFIAQATREAEQLAATLPDIALWVSYHNYYKAPDLIGPAVAQTRGVPYILIEATRAKKRLTGSWARFAERAETASDAAAVIFHFTERDRQALEQGRTNGQQIVPLAPFLPRDNLPPQSGTQGAMLSVGMMRPGDKLASYRLIAEALKQVSHKGWQLDIVGDGPAAPDIRALFAPFGSQVRFLGKLDHAELDTVYASAGFFLWPGVNEAFGMVYLEAQAAGLPVVAQDRPGVRDVLAPGVYPAPGEGAAGLAARIDHLLSHRAERLHLGKSARQHVATHHLQPAACACLRRTLAPLIRAAS